MSRLRAAVALPVVVALHVIIRAIGVLDDLQRALEDQP